MRSQQLRGSCIAPPQSCPREFSREARFVLQDGGLEWPGGHGNASLGEEEVVEQEEC